MDNTQDVVSGAPAVTGQAQTTTAQVPGGDASGYDAAGAAVGTAAPEGQGTDTAAAAGEGLLLGKFKSAEELAKAYTELESHNKKVEMDNAELAKLFAPDEPQSTEPTPTVQPAPAEESQDAALKRLINEATKEATKAAIAPLVAQREIEYVAGKYGDDFRARAKDVASLRKQNPNLSLEAAYKLVAFDDLKRTATSTGVAQGQQVQQQIQKAQVESARPSGYRAPNLEDAVKDKNVPLADILEALGPEYGAFAEITKRRASGSR